MGLCELFERIDFTVSREGDHNLTSLPMEFEMWEALEKAKKFLGASDDEYFQELARVVFSSSLPAHVASERLAALEEGFSHYADVADYDNTDVAMFLDRRAMVKHDRKIRRLIAIAKTFRSVVTQFGSFEAYLNSMGGKDIESALLVRADLMRRFTFLGRFTSLLFLRGIGYPILRLDASVMRVFSRLGIVHDFAEPEREVSHPTFHEPQVLEALRAGAQIAAKIGKPIHYINMIVIAFAEGSALQDGELPGGICTNRMPKCYRCAVNERCQFSPKTKAMKQPDHGMPFRLVTGGPAQHGHTAA